MTRCSFPRRCAWPLKISTTVQGRCRTPPRPCCCGSLRCGSAAPRHSRMESHPPRPARKDPTQAPIQPSSCAHRPKSIRGSPNLPRATSIPPWSSGRPPMSVRTIAARLAQRPPHGRAGTIAGVQPRIASRTRRGDPRVRFDTASRCRWSTTPGQASSYGPPGAAASCWCITACPTCWCRPRARSTTMTACKRVSAATRWPETSTGCSWCPACRMNFRTAPPTRGGSAAADDRSALRCTHGRGRQLARAHRRHVAGLHRLASVLPLSRQGGSASGRFIHLRLAHHCGAPSAASGQANGTA